MNNRLTKYAKDNNMINKAQIGFTENNRCPDHILTMKSLSNKYVTDTKGGKLYTCFIDFRKAFDTVWHEGVFQKLIQANITGNFLNTLKNMYKKTKCAVKIGNKMTQFFPCQKGVRQGDPLSPLLFNIFINDIFNRLQATDCAPATLNGTDFINALAYADDIVLISTSAEGLQKAIDITHKYCQEWKLEVNHKKTKCITFTKGTQREKVVFKIGNKILENATEMKYLGITVGKKNCSFVPAISALKTKATRALYALRAKIDINRLPIKLALKLFDTLIKPILLYASEVWEPFLNQDSAKWDYNDIEKIHLQFMKRIMGVNRSTTNILIRGEMNRHSLQEEILRRNIRYADYIHNKEENTMVKQAYLHELSRPPGCITFMNTIDKNVEPLHSLHSKFFPYNNPYENIYEIPDGNLLLYTYQIFHNEWRTKLEDSIKGETYRSFKENMKFEPYLNLQKRKHRVLLCKLRTSDHKLRIEDGRRTKPKTPREQRTCFQCPTQVEDEKHFLVDCKLYGSRPQLYNIIEGICPEFTRLDNQNKFIYLMTQESQAITTSLVSELEDWLNLRELLCTYFFQP